MRISFRTALAAALTALLAGMVIIVGLDFVLSGTAGASPAVHTMNAGTTAAWETQTPTTNSTDASLQAQLVAAGYKLAKTGQAYNSDTHAVTHWQIWTQPTQPTVNLADSYTTKSGTFRIDSVVYPQAPAGYTTFGCASNADTDLVLTLSAADATWNALDTGSLSPVPDDVLPREFKVYGPALCWVTTA